MGGESKVPSFGEGLLEGLREAVAWKRGEVVLEVVNIEPVQPAPSANAWHAPPGNLRAHGIPKK